MLQLIIIMFIVVLRFSDKCVGCKICFIYYTMIFQHFRLSAVIFLIGLFFICARVFVTEEIFRDFIFFKTT